jgi:hypothetical protein
MNVKIKHIWITALRSGEYYQNISGKLKDGDTFCVLGVLVNELGYKILEDGKQIKGFDDFNIVRDMVLPKDIRDRCGLTYELVKSLYMMNDEYEYSFEYLAEWIEKNL